MAGIKLTLKGFKRFKRALNGKSFQKELERHVRTANGRSGKIIQRAIRQTIKKGVPPPNAPLTVAIKGSSKPLVDRGDLFGAVTSVVPSWNRVFVGVLKTSKSHDIAQLLHDGTTLGVTDKMRGLFYVLWLATKREDVRAKLSGRAAELFERMPSGWKPLRPSTRAIKIPARPFISQAFTPAVRARVIANWNEAIQRAIRANAGG